MRSKEISNMAATAKRSATSIRHLARCLEGLSLTEKNTLVDAAALLLKHGDRTKNKALGEKRVEQARERAQAKARIEARQIIVGWPKSSTLDRVALIHSTQWGAERLARRADENNPRWELDYAAGDAAEDIVSDAVTHAVPYLASTAAVPVADHMARVRALVETIRGRPGIVALAAQWDARIG